MNQFVQKMDRERRMALDNVGPIRMTFNEDEGDFESCPEGYCAGQAFCASDLDLFFKVTDAEVIEVTPYKRPGKNRVKIESSSFNHLTIDGERWNLYIKTVKTAGHWIYKGYSYVGIEVIE